MSSDRAPGADDDGFGTVTLFENLRALAANEFVPKRTVEFQFYMAEDAGLLGSQEITSNYKRNNINVVTMLQLNMAGRMPNGTSYLDGIIRCGYACSDHASFNKYVFPSAKAFEAITGGADNPYIHTFKDIIENGIGLNPVLEFAKHSLAYLHETSNA
ncbi:uncharacterized protein VTP21DRAFT_5347 [Calcarisporiella thermophila]|uniref:uncharacterized protein n=1 Tax=Calcarisporiella thermophila TaxID=911321 RepID=UPI003743BB5D